MTLMFFFLELVFISVETMDPNEKLFSPYFPRKQIDGNMVTIG